MHADLPLGHQENLLIGLHGPLQGRNGDVRSTSKVRFMWGKTVSPRRAKPGMFRQFQGPSFLPWAEGLAPETLGFLKKGEGTPRPFPLRFKKAAQGGRGTGPVSRFLAGVQFHGIADLPGIVGQNGLTFSLHAVPGDDCLHNGRVGGMSYMIWVSIPSITARSPRAPISLGTVV